MSLERFQDERDIFECSRSDEWTDFVLERGQDPDDYSGHRPLYSEVQDCEVQDAAPEDDPAVCSVAYRQEHFIDSLSRDPIYTIGH